MTSDLFNLATVDGWSLFGRAWVPDGEVRGVVCLVHGLGEHGGRYERLAARLLERDFAVLTFDQRGFGRSPGARGCIDRYEDLLDDIGRLLKEKEKRFAQRRCFLYGHSMGGALVLNYVLRRQPRLAGVVATAPWLELVREPGFAVTALAAVMNVVRPGLTIANGIEPGLLCRDREVVANYTGDPLVHDRISARLFTACREAGRWALDRAGEFPRPLLLMHGDADRITSARASQAFAARAGAHCTFRLWPGWYHELHNEPDNGEFFTFLARWLEERIAGGP